MTRIVFVCLFLMIWGSKYEVAEANHRRCEKIISPVCQGLGYNTTSMPNFVGHEDQQDATLGLQEFSGFLTHRCSPFLRLFVCSVYVPLCSEHVPGAVPACRSLCEEVKKDCLADLEAAGFSWPAQLNCSRFPEPPDLCMQQPPEDDGHVAVANEVIPSNHLHRYKMINSNCPQNTVPIGERCMKLCNSDTNLLKNNQFLYEVWSAVWSIISVLLTSFALSTFLIQPKRFRWPARPILYLTTCGFITSLIYFIRWIAGPFTCTGEIMIEKSYDNLTCVCSALFLIFCEFSFCLWWCVFCFVWYLSASKEWSTEALEKTAPRLHGLVWTLSFLPIIFALISNNIKTNHFTGFCEVNSYLITSFQIIILIVGAILAVITSVALRNVRRALIFAGRSPFKLERLICRLGVICLGIFIPLLVSLLCHYFDSFSISLLKVGLRFLSIIFASLWVFSSKTFKSWNKILKPAFTSKSLRNSPVTKV